MTDARPDLDRPAPTPEAAPPLSAEERQLLARALRPALPHDPASDGGRRKAPPLSWHW